MVLAVLTILGRRFRLVLEPVEETLPPRTFDAVAEPAEGPALAKPALRLVRATRAA